MAQTQEQSIPLWKTFAVLVGLTAGEVALVLLRVPKSTVVAALIVIETLKALLAAIYFMHLKFEGRLIWGMLIASIVLGVAFVLILFPDIVFGYWR